jgi:glutaminyl-tRNA synthetase
VDAKTAVPLTVRVYDYLMIEDENGENVLNPNSLKIMNAMAEPSLADAKAGDRFQFLRKGYYIADPVLYTEENRVFNQIVDLKSSWKK